MYSKYRVRLCGHDRGEANQARKNREPATRERDENGNHVDAVPRCHPAARGVGEDVIIVASAWEGPIPLPTDDPPPRPAGGGDKHTHMDTNGTQTDPPHAHVNT